MSTAKERELEEMKALLDKEGYHPLHAHQLQKEGMGPNELAQRLKTKNGVGSLEYSHNFTRGAAPSHTNTPAPGRKRPGLHKRARGPAKGWPAFDPADFDLKGEMEGGYIISEAKGGRHGGYNVAVEGRHLCVTHDWNKALCCVVEAQKKANFFANVFYVNERGNVDLLIVHSKSAKRCESRIVHSWV